MLIRHLVVAIALAASFQAHGHSFQAGQLTIVHPFARATAPGQPSAAAYMTIKHKGNGGDRLIAASTPGAKSVEIHTMSMDGNVMRMRPVESIEIRQGATVLMKPGAGYHLMLLGLPAPLKAGDNIPMTLTFEKAGKVEISVSVDATAPPAQPAGSDDAHAHH